jgi:hypothetical protein
VGNKNKVYVNVSGTYQTIRVRGKPHFVASGEEIITDANLDRYIKRGMLKLVPQMSVEELEAMVDEILSRGSNKKKPSYRSIDSEWDSSDLCTLSKKKPVLALAILDVYRQKQAQQASLHPGGAG